METVITIRPIAPGDDAALARIIRDTLTEFGAAKPGSVFYDPSTDHLHALFQHAQSAYFVAEADGMVLGGAGIYPTDNLPADTTELVKVYLLPQARGRGLGRQLLEKCLAEARARGYGRVYLESFEEMTQALPLYEKLGFHYLPQPMGNSGHFSCQIWMIREL
ncbi:GNAT family N-acetyltransferase [Hymenobacter baengnokdamensis]|uniref:GNAT family N-acetyltransferase n=1 Tax=Hymenobacter baengnokdamensis TaxID=2615203 RepID=UPI001245A22C|nr:GNAT family N-acetyltransferase [Hymenobacter baengnokdamensis]